MTTVVPFEPTATSAFTFQATLDGGQYAVSVPWNLYGQRYYVQIADTSGNLIVNRALVGSPAALQIQTASWANGTVSVQVVSPYYFPFGSVVEATISGCLPNTYNGQYLITVLGPSSFSYPLANDPGQLSLAGSVQDNINLAAPYFQTSTLVYRSQLQQFEITP